MEKMTSKEALEELAKVYGYYFGDRYQLQEMKKVIEDEIVRLKRYEKLEEELGVDLITLIKAIESETIWFKKHLGAGKYKIVEVHSRGLNINQYTHEVSIKDENGSLHLLGGYGKTWALTREELNNEDRT